MLVDFHTHSTASDGTLTPEALTRRALEAGIERFAITDHDTVAGLEPAAAAAPEGWLVAGVELSCHWNGAGIHVLGLGIDCRAPSILAALQRAREARERRAATIAQRLERAGITGALAGAREEAGAGVVGRPHFARWLVARGHFPDEATAFKRFLGRGRPGDVRAEWPAIGDVTRAIADARGIAVLAHPLKYRLTHARLRRLLDVFAASGGRGLEVLSGRQDPGQTRELCRLATHRRLLVSAGSDFHGDAPHARALGVESGPFDGLDPVWAHLPEPA